MPPAGELRHQSPSKEKLSSVTQSDEAEAASAAISAAAADAEAAGLWTQIKAEARRDAEAEPALASYLYSTILSHSSLERSISFHLGNKLCSSTLLSTLLYDLFLNTFSSDPSLRNATVADLRAARVRDPACISFSHCLLNYKGFLAIQVKSSSFDLMNPQFLYLAI
jgi:serine O-acetyltransferase